MGHVPFREGLDRLFSNGGLFDNVCGVDHIPATSGQGQLVTTRREGPVLVVGFNRPSKGNAVTLDMERALYSAFAAAGVDPHVRAVVLTGEGRSFCVGADTGDLSELASGTQEHGAGRDFPFNFLHEFDKPLVAAVNGGCAGVGLLYALYADVVIASREAKFTTAFAQRGVIAEYGISKLLSETVGRKRAADLLLSARVFTGADAHQYGLVQEAVAPSDVVEVAVRYATELATRCSPWSMAMIKGQLRTEPEMSLAAAERNAAELLRIALSSSDFAEGVASYLERRSPRFSPLDRNSL